LQKSSSNNFGQRLHHLSEALRSFGLVDHFQLRGLIRSDSLPVKSKILKHLANGTRSLPPSVSPSFVADMILAALREADDEAGIRKPRKKRFNLAGIKPGRAQAGKYHKTVFEALSYVFSPALRNGKIEREVDEGRKRIDILFENPLKSGFFRRLTTQHQIFCPLIFVECKNYQHDPANPEFDQLIGRFHEKRGKFGILVCRRIVDTKAKLARCGNVIGGGSGYIIVLEDTDIMKLVAARNQDDIAQVNDLLSEKLTEALLNAP
jgi:hypothetical protein